MRVESADRAPLTDGKQIERKFLPPGAIKTNLCRAHCSAIWSEANASNSGRGHASTFVARRGSAPISCYSLLMNKPGAGRYVATPHELAGIDRGLIAADEGHFATAEEVEDLFSKHRPRHCAGAPKPKDSTE
jgi:hypothetical protein